MATEDQKNRFKATTLAWLSSLEQAPTEDDIAITDDGSSLTATVHVHGDVLVEEVASKLSEAEFPDVVNKAFIDDSINFMPSAQVATEVRQIPAPSPSPPSTPLLTPSLMPSTHPPPSTPPLFMHPPLQPPFAPSPPMLPKPLGSLPPPSPLAPSLSSFPVSPPKLAPPQPPKPHPQLQPACPPKVGRSTPPAMPRVAPLDPSGGLPDEAGPVEGGERDSAITGSESATGSNNTALVLILAIALPILVIGLIFVLLCCWYRVARAKASLKRASIVNNADIIVKEDGEDIEVRKDDVDRRRKSSKSKLLAMVSPVAKDVSVVKSDEPPDYALPYSKLEEQREPERNGSEQKGSEQMDSSRSWRSFAMSEEQALAIANLAGTAEQSEAADETRGSNAERRKRVAPPSPKLSAATGLFLQLLADNQPMNSYGEQPQDPQPMKEPEIPQLDVKEPEAPTEPPKQKKRSAKIASLMSVFDSVQEETPKSPKKPPHETSMPPEQIHEPLSPMGGSPGDRQYPPAALLRARRANDVKKAAMVWLKHEQERQSRAEQMLESDVGEAIDPDHAQPSYLEAVEEIGTEPGTSSELGPRVQGDDPFMENTDASQWRV